MCGRTPQAFAVRSSDTALQLYRFLQYELAHVAVGRRLIQALIDPDLSSGDTAWFGGNVYTEKNPGECPVSRLVATMRIQRSTLSSLRERRRAFRYARRLSSSRSVSQ